MRKKTPRIFLAIILISTSAMIALVIFALAKPPTNVNGMITSDTTWTSAGSPFNLTGNVTITHGATLAIQPGATVHLNSYVLQVEGTLTAKGTSTNPIQFRGDVPCEERAILFQSTSVPWNETTDTGCIIENCQLTAAQVVIQGASPKINQNTLTDVYCDRLIDVKSGAPTISNNILTGKVRSATYGYAGETALLLGINSSATVCNNVIKNAFSGICVSGGESTVYLGKPIITGNLICNHLTEGIYLGSPVTATIQNNTITGNLRAIRLHAFNPNSTFTGNNLEGNNQTIVLQDLETNANMTYNWWGTTDAQAISQTFSYYGNDHSAGAVLYTPLLTAWNPGAPNAPLSTEFIIIAIIATVLIASIEVALLLRRRRQNKAA